MPRAKGSQRSTSKARDGGQRARTGCGSGFELTDLFQRFQGDRVSRAGRCGVVEGRPFLVQSSLLPSYQPSHTFQPSRSPSLPVCSPPRHFPPLTSHPFPSHPFGPLPETNYISRCLLGLPCSRTFETPCARTAYDVSSTQLRPPNRLCSHPNMCYNTLGFLCV